MDERLERYLRSKLRAAGRRFEESRRAFDEGRTGGAERDDEGRDGAERDEAGRDEAERDDGDRDAAGRDGAAATESGTWTGSDLPTDGEGRARIVCRRHAEKRAVRVDEEGRPACFDPDHPDCRGCVEDLREGVVETW